MNIKLHLDYAEYDPIKRTAEAFGCDVEDVVYAAVNAYMLRLGSLEEHCGPECRKTFSDPAAMRTAVLNTKLARKNNLPKWADSAGSAHNYEGFPPDEPTKSAKSKF